MRLNMTETWHDGHTKWFAREPLETTTTNGLPQLPTWYVLSSRRRGQGRSAALSLDLYAMKCSHVKIFCVCVCHPDDSLPKV